jgi:hypothetical protein
MGKLWRLKIMFSFTDRKVEMREFVVGEDGRQEILAWSKLQNEKPEGQRPWLLAFPTADGGLQTFKSYQVNHVDLFPEPTGS